MFYNSFLIISNGIMDTRQLRVIVAYRYEVSYLFYFLPVARRRAQTVTWRNRWSSWKSQSIVGSSWCQLRRTRKVHQESCWTYSKNCQGCKSSISFFLSIRHYIIFIVINKKFHDQLYPWCKLFCTYERVLVLNFGENNRKQYLYWLRDSSLSVWCAQIPVWTVPRGAVVNPLAINCTWYLLLKLAGTL